MKIHFEKTKNQLINILAILNVFKISTDESRQHDKIKKGNYRFSFWVFVFWVNSKL